jgi:hypothetical protein
MAPAAGVTELVDAPSEGEQWLHERSPRPRLGSKSPPSKLLVRRLKCPMTATPEPRESFSVSWKELHRDAKTLAWRLLELGPWKGMVAVTRGGLAPAAIVARALDIRLKSNRIPQAEEIGWRSVG